MWLKTQKPFIISEGSSPVPGRSGLLPRLILDWVAKGVWAVSGDARMTISIQRLIDDAKCYEMVRELRWPDDGVTCPHCGGLEIVKNGHDTTQRCRQRYCCSTCRKSFDDLTDTELHHELDEASHRLREEKYQGRKTLTTASVVRFRAKQSSKKCLSLSAFRNGYDQNIHFSFQG